MQKKAPRRPKSHVSDDGGLEFGTVSAEIHHSESGDPQATLNQPDVNPVDPIPGPSHADASSFDSDDFYSPSHKKKSGLLPDMDKDLFDSLYHRQNPSSVGPKRKITKIFPRQTPPDWLTHLGDPSFNDNGKWNIQIPDCLIASVAGHKSIPQEFTVSSNVDLLSEIFDLVNSKISAPPKLGRYIPNLSCVFSSLKHWFKVFALSWAQAKVTYAEFWEDVEYMDHVVIPTLYSCMEGISSTVLTARQMVLASSPAPYALKKQYLSAPVFPLWPDNPELIKSIKQFFLFKTSRKENNRYFKGRFFRGRYFRGRAQRGFFRSRRGLQRGRWSRGYRRSANMQPILQPIAQDQRH